MTRREVERLLELEKERKLLRDKLEVLVREDFERRRSRGDIRGCFLRLGDIDEDGCDIEFLYCEDGDSRCDCPEHGYFSLQSAWIGD